MLCVVGDQLVVKMCSVQPSLTQTENEDEDNEAVDIDADQPEYDALDSDASPTLPPEQVLASRDRAFAAWRRHLDAEGTLRRHNAALRRRVRATENKCESVTTQVAALRDLYR